MTEDAMIPLLPAATRIACRGWPERRRPHKRPRVTTSKPDNLVQAVYDRYRHVKKGHLSSTAAGPVRWSVRPGLACWCVWKESADHER
jgi:hypothetical protein